MVKVEGPKDVIITGAEEPVNTDVITVDDDRNGAGLIFSGTELTGIFLNLFLVQL